MYVKRIDQNLLLSVKLRQKLRYLLFVIIIVTKAFSLTEMSKVNLTC